MGDSVMESLILDLLEWLVRRDGSYEEVMEAWRTSYDLGASRISTLASAD
jgi:hypothetical protein